MSDQYRVLDKLLMDDHPIQVLPQLAVVLNTKYEKGNRTKSDGLGQAMVLQQLHYWLRLSKHDIDGHKWVYNSVAKWQEQFPFWSDDTVAKILKQLETRGLVVSGRFNKLALDRTKWYRIDYDKFAALVPLPLPQPSAIGDSSKDNQPLPQGSSTNPETIGKQYQETTTETTSENKPKEPKVTTSTDESVEGPLAIDEKTDELVIKPSSHLKKVESQHNTFTKFDDPKYLYVLRQGDLDYFQSTLKKLFDYPMVNEDIEPLKSMIRSCGKLAIAQAFRGMKDADYELELDGIGEITMQDIRDSLTEKERLQFGLRVSDEPDWVQTSDFTYEDANEYGGREGLARQIASDLAAVPPDVMEQLSQPNAYSPPRHDPVANAKREAANEVNRQATKAVQYFDGAIRKVARRWGVVENEQRTAMRHLVKAHGLDRVIEMIDFAAINSGVKSPKALEMQWKKLDALAVASAVGEA